MNGKKWLLLALLSLGLQYADAQVAGGDRAFEFLRLPNSPHITALGGINVADPDQDIAFAIQNPALMRPGLHNQIGLNYDNYYAGISVANLQYGYHVPEIKTSFVLGVQYLNYGSFTQTDLTGNENGTVSAADYSVSLGASRQYLEHWHYGAAIKWAHSTLSSNYAAALLGDVGIAYMDTASLVSFGAVAKNIGVMAKHYTGSPGSEPLPFDLQLGISKRFKHLPLRLMATVHHLYEWDIRYDNPADIQSSNLFGTQDTTSNKSTHFADKLFRHFIFGAELAIGKYILVSVAYNHMRRQELVITDKTGVAGFSFGLGVNLNKFQIHYGRSYYSIAGAYNEIGLNMSLNKILGIGKLGDKTHWGATYPDWE